MRYQGSIRVGDRLLDMSEPHVMGIINLTPDSFYAPSRLAGSDGVADRVRAMIEAGATMIDVGACSTRPGSSPASEAEETERLRQGLPAVMSEAKGRAAVSVDTFRADVARMCVEEFGVEIVNDIGGGTADRHMFRTVAALRVPYVLTHSDDVTAERELLPAMMLQLSRRLVKLRDMGVADVIIDPGFGFGKTLEQNYQIMAGLENFSELQQPLLVGISRKSMIWRLLDTTPENTLNATTALHAVALQKGAGILRVHDVEAAVEAVRLNRQLERVCQSCAATDATASAGQRNTPPETAC